jgi:hypothetical protein
MAACVSCPQWCNAYCSELRHCILTTSLQIASQQVNMVIWEAKAPLLL